MNTLQVNRRELLGTFAAGAFVFGFPTGAAIPRAHATGYPAYRLEWQALGPLERRLRNCVAGVRAEPFAPGADEWLALEVYLMQRAAGMAHEGVAVRP